MKLKLQKDGQFFILKNDDITGIPRKRHPLNSQSGITVVLGLATSPAAISFLEQSAILYRQMLH